MIAGNRETWPISMSLRNPLPDRAIKNVGMWIAPPLHGDAEAEAVSKIFEEDGIKVTQEWSSGGYDQERFERFYIDDEWDVFWVIGHGVHQSFAPETSRIAALDDQSGIDIGRLASMPMESGNRRLLVLNICDGSSPTTRSGFSRISIAGLAASACQATISHLWTVDPVAAAIFGTILAGALVRKKEFFAAYNATIVTLNDRNRNISEILETLGAANLVDILRRTECRGEIDMKNPLHRLSGTFYS